MSKAIGSGTEPHHSAAGIGGGQLLELRGAQAPEGDWFDQATQRLLGLAETMPWGEEITMEISESWVERLCPGRMLNHDLQPQPAIARKVGAVG